MPHDPQRITIFLHATKDKAPEASVFVQLVCLVAALGSEAAQQLLPSVDVPERLAAEQRRLEDERTRLKQSLEEQRQLAALGFSESREAVKQLQQQLQAAEQGRFQTPALVSVPVGPFRAALLAARDSLG